MSVPLLIWLSFGIADPSSLLHKLAVTYQLNRILQDLVSRTQDVQKNNSGYPHFHKKENSMPFGEVPKSSLEKVEEPLHVKNASQGDIPFSGPLQVSTSSGFAWARRRRDDASIKSHFRSISRGNISNAVEASNNLDSKRDENSDVVCRTRTDSRGHGSYEISKLAVRNPWGKFERPDSFDGSDGYHSQELSLANYQQEIGVAKGDVVSLFLQLPGIEFCFLVFNFEFIKNWDVATNRPQHIKAGIEKFCNAITIGMQ